MIWIFDLDETLYDESNFVRSGLQAVSLRLCDSDQKLQEDMFKTMWDRFSEHGRGGVFQELLQKFPDIQLNVEELISIFRSHEASLTLYEDARRLLAHLEAEKKYLVTDGNRVTQRGKIAALGIETIFDGIFVTDENGIGAPKPGIKCFEMIKAKEDCRWSDMVYIGDDPNKDFISIKAKGVHTIRVNRGRFMDLQLDLEHEAEILFNDLNDLHSRLQEGDFFN